MKKFCHLIFGAFIITIMFSSCTTQPTADFSFDNNYAEAPATIYFENSSTDAKDYEWSFGDGGSSSQTNPSHTYVEAGTYNVQLIAKNKSKSDSYSKTVTIIQPTTYQFKNNLSETIPNSFSFHYSSGDFVDIVQHGNLFGGQSTQEVKTDWGDIDYGFEIYGDTWITNYSYDLSENTNNICNLYGDTEFVLWSKSDEKTNVKKTLMEILKR